jgi:predicted kinase
MDMKHPQAPYNIMMCGLPGSNKSAVAAKFAKQYDMTVISASALRNALGPYEHYRFWAEALEMARAAAAQGKKVIYDATNLKAEDRIARLIDLRDVAPGPWMLCEMQTTLDAACDQVKGSYLTNEDVMASVLEQFRSPSISEGFDRIVTLRQDGSVARSLMRKVEAPEQARA